MISRDYIQFGDLKLGVIGGLTAFDGERGYDYAKYDIVTGKPLSAPVGEKLRTVSLKISLRYYLGDDIKKTIETLDDMLASGNAFDLIFANGIYKGKYFIEKIRDSIKKTLPDGNVLEYDTSIDVEEYAARTVLSAQQHTEKKKVAKQKGDVTHFAKDAGSSGLVLGGHAIEL